MPAAGFKVTDLKSESLTAFIGMDSQQAHYILDFCYQKSQDPFRIAKVVPRKNPEVKFAKTGVLS
jgi:hypothetical protein